MKPPLHQRAIKTVMYILAGFLGLGSLLDSLANAISLLTPLVASIGTACIVLVWVLAYLILPSHPLPWVFGNQQMPVKKPGIQPTAFAVGMVLLLWMPSVITQWQTHPPPSSDKGTPGAITASRDVLMNAPSGVIHIGQGSISVTNIHQGISGEEHARLAKELGVTQSALASFFKILEQQHVPLENLDSTLRKIATSYKELYAQLQRFTSEDHEVMVLRQQARQALEAGDFARVETLLDQAQARDLQAIQAQQTSLKQRQLSAAATSAELGALKNIQLSYAASATQYRQAARVVPQDEALTQAAYLNAEGSAWIAAGQYAEAQPPLEHALALREKGLGPEHPDVAVSLNKLAEL
jgi:hypothetical protein